MMDHKKRINRSAKGQIVVMLSAIGEDKKKELIEKYKKGMPQEEMMTESSLKILIGNWFNNAVKLLLRGATKEEIDRVLEHIIVLLGCAKYNIDVQKSYKDHDLLDLTRKYFGEKKVEVKVKPVSEERKEFNEKRERERYKLKLEILNLREDGYTIEQIAEAMRMSESTVRTILDAK